MKFPKLLPLLTAGLLCSSYQANANIVLYSEVNGTYLTGLDSVGTLGTGGSLSGLSTAAFSNTNYLGVEDGYYGVVNGSGFAEYYAYAAGNVASPYCCISTSATHILGSLAGGATKDGSYLGTMNALNVYADSTGIVSYAVLNNVIFNDTLWTTYSGGGSMLGLTPTRGQGLLDFAGNTDMNDLYILNVGTDGTLEYYNSVTGAFTPGLDVSYGSWTTFGSGPLGGLTLTGLKANAIGSANGVPYRYLGTSNDTMVFEVPASVPEPSAAVLALGAGFTFLRRRRRA